MNWPRRERREIFWTSTFKLLGHITGSALVFVFLVTIEWSVSWFVSALNGLRPMDADESLVMGHVGRGLLYGDAALAGILFLTNFYRFLRDLWRN